MLSTNKTEKRMFHFQVSWELPPRIWLGHAGTLHHLGNVCWLNLKQREIIFP